MRPPVGGPNARTDFRHREDSILLLMLFTAAGCATADDAFGQ
jgi:hypothetical protein